MIFVRAFSRASDHPRPYIRRSGCADRHHRQRLKIPSAAAVVRCGERKVRPRASGSGYWHFTNLHVHAVDRNSRFTAEAQNAQSLSLLCVPCASAVNLHVPWLPPQQISSTTKIPVTCQRTEGRGISPPQGPLLRASTVVTPQNHPQESRKTVKVLIFCSSSEVQAGNLLRSRPYRRRSAPWVAAYRFIVKGRKLNHGGTEAQRFARRITLALLRVSVSPWLSFLSFARRRTAGSLSRYLPTGE